MTIPKEIRLRMLEFVVDDVRPMLQFAKLSDQFGVPDVYNLRLSLTHTAEIDADEYVNSLDQFLPHIRGQHVREINFHLACRLLREEFFQILGESQTLDLSAYGNLISAIHFSRRTLPSLAQILSSDYTKYVRHIEYSLKAQWDTLREVELPEDFAKTLPALARVSIRTYLQSNTLSQEGFSDLSDDELAAGAPSNAVVECVRQQLLKCVERCKLQGGRQFLLDFRFWLAAEIFGCSECESYTEFGTIVVSLSIVI